LIRFDHHQRDRSQITRVTALAFTNLATAGQLPCCKDGVGGRSWPIIAAQNLGLNRLPNTDVTSSQLDSDGSNGSLDDGTNGDSPFDLHL